MLTLLTRLYFSLVQYLFTLLAFYDPIAGPSDSPKTEDNNFLGVSTDQLYNSLTKQKSSSSSSFLWPFIWLVFFEVIGIFGLEMDSSGWPPWPLGPLWSQLATSPVIFAHQIIPRAVWPQIDLFIYTAVNGALVAAAVLYKTPPVGDDHRLEVKEEEEEEEGERNKEKRFLVTKSSTFRRTLDERSSATILRVRSALYRYFYLLVAVFVVVLLSFYYLMVCLNGAFRWSALSLLYWSTIFPVAIFHAIIGKQTKKVSFI